MFIIKYLSNLTSIDSKYLILVSKSILIFIVLEIIKKVLIKIVCNIKDSKKEYIYTQRIKLVLNIFISLFLLFIWSEKLNNIITLVTFISASFTIAIRDIILNFFCGIYIKINKPFSIEDRIEINGFKGDVININSLNFELLEVTNTDFCGQSTGIITHLPNSLIFSSPLRNYNKGFKYIWNEITINVPLDFDISKAKGVIYRVVNSNDIIKMIPEKMKKEINRISNDYRIYYNQYNPNIYMKVMGNYVEYTVRYLVHPKKARYVNSSIWKHLLLAYQNGEIELYQS